MEGANGDAFKPLQLALKTGNPPDISRMFAVALATYP
jgi:hypothetical protein